MLAGHIWWMLGGFLAATGVLSLYFYGRRSARLPGDESTVLPAGETQTAFDAAVSPVLSQNAGQTGLKLLTENIHAFAARAASARYAERSLDLQYYYWKDDLTGGLLLDEVIKAADRGVRVRLLIDDINTRGRDRNYRALQSHPNIQVRLFNPTRCRENSLLRGIEMVVRLYSINRRMHHKAWIVDGRLAIVGGRNIGDAYFDAADSSNFRDMDVLAIGPAVEQAGAVFDRYWNSPMVAPIRKISGFRRSELRKLRERLAKLTRADNARPYLDRLRQETGAGQMLADRSRLYWTDTARIISDPPEKAAGARDENWLVKTIFPILMSAKENVQITSPYFIPRSDGTNQLIDLFRRGVAVSVLTNSLAATDVAAVHGAYLRYRKRLVEAGVRLFELRAREAVKDMSLFGSRGASLHTKAFVVDGRSAFVGSFNFDPRSASLNTEMGLLFEHPVLAQEMRDVFAQETAPERSYSVVVKDGRVRWRDGGSLLRHEPDAGLGRRAVAWIVSKLPIQSQL